MQNEMSAEINKPFPVEVSHCEGAASELLVPPKRIRHTPHADSSAECHWGEVPAGKIHRVINWQSGKRHYSSLGLFSLGFANSGAAEHWMNWTGKSLTSPLSVAVDSSPLEKSHTSNTFASWETKTTFCASIKEILIILTPECMLTFIFPEKTKSDKY